MRRVINQSLKVGYRFWMLSMVCGVVLTTSAFAQQSRYVVIDQDAMGPAGTDMNSILVFLQARNVNVLGITVVTGDGWREEEVAHTLRLLELVGRTDIPVAAGAAFPLVRTQQWTHAWEQIYGKVRYQGAWGSFRPNHGALEVPALPEGNPTTKPIEEDAAHFLIRMVHKYPHRVTVYAAGPMTNIAQAITLDPQFAELADQLVIMGGALNPHTDDKEYMDSPRREFNLWFDPEASSITLHAHWPRITATPVDVSIETHLTQEMLEKLSHTPSAAAQYIARYTRKSGDYLWDELAAAAWLDPSLITRERYVYMDVSLDKGISYGDTLVWSDEDKPELELEKAHVQMDVDWPKFQSLFMQLMSSPTPNAKHPQLGATPPGQGK
jgi:inosine-uridine nucleoside N-ribohydrolase